MLNIRYANKYDIKNVFNLSNDDTVRKNSFNTEKIKWENHVNWFEKKIKDINSIFYVGYDNEVFVGYCRLDKNDNNEWVVTIHINKKFRGKGYGKKLLNYVCENNKGKKIISFVKESNLPSYYLFLHNNFKQVNLLNISGGNFYKMQKQNGKNILISGAGGSATYFLIQTLQKHGYRVVAIDMDKTSVGLLYADKAYTVPAGNNKDFIPAIKKICDKENIDLFIPLVDEELVNSCDLRKNNIKVLLPTKEFTCLCLDKYKLMKALESLNINAPKTYYVNEFNNQISYPLIIKPNIGRGSRGVKILYKKRDLDEYLKNTTYEKENLIIQEFIDGDEYTVSTVVSETGLLQAVVPKKIILKKGITKYAVTEKNKKIYEYCKQIQEKLKANGPFNVQLKLNNKNKEPYAFEINPRFSTSITLTMASGVNELIMLTQQFLGEKKPEVKNNWKENVVLVRQNQDCFITKAEYDNKVKDIEEII